MKCPRCGTENPSEARFCQSCGTTLSTEPDAAIPTLPTGRGPEPGTTPFAAGAGDGTAQDIGPALSLEGVDRRPPNRLVEALSGGWGTAAAGAGLTFVILLLVGQALAALMYAAIDDPPALPDVFKIGGFLTFAFHRVGVQIAFPDFTPPDVGGLGGVPQVPGAVSIDLTVSIALLLGTGLLVAMLYRAGRTLGVAAGGPAWVRGVAGAKVAVPYAALTGVVALLFSFAPLGIDVPAIPNFSGGGAIELSPSVLAAFLWPLVLGLIAGFAGGALSAPASSWERPRGDVLLAGALRGGLVAVGVAAALAFAGVEIVAFVHPEAGFPFNPTFFEEAFASEPLDGIATTTFALFTSPNLAGLALAPAMGSSLGFSAPGFDQPLLSLFEFPTGFNPEALAGLGGLGVPGGAGPLIESGAAPGGYWLFLLVPLVATVLGGRAAARRTAAGGRGEAVVAGLLAGVVYAVLATTFIVASGVGFRFQGGFAGLGLSGPSQAAHIGAMFPLTAVLALVWGLAGGALGGALAGSPRQPAHAATGTAAFGFGSPPPPPPHGGEPPGPPAPDDEERPAD